MIKADGFDEAAIGTAYVRGHDVLVYSVERCLDVLVQQGMSREDAVDYFEFNVGGAYVGEETPIFVYDLMGELDDWEEE
jgi:hypothetical protein